MHSVRLGGVSGVDTGTNGTEYFDGFVARRATYIGLVPNDGLSLAKTEGKGGKVLAKPVAPGMAASSPAEETGITITYTYDPLDRLTAADYSNGVYFHYTYDLVGREALPERSGGRKSMRWKRWFTLPRSPSNSFS